MYKNLRKIRKERNIPVNDILTALGLSELSAYYKKETGLIKFSLEEAKIISDFLGLPIENIFFDDELSKKEHISHVGRKEQGCSKMRSVS